MPSTPVTSDTTQKNEQENLNYFLKIWRFRHYLTVEPFVVVSLLATIINSIAVQYFPISKACHVNLGYNKDLCDAIFSKTEYNIDCDIFNFENVTDLKADTMDSMKNINKISDEFKYTACKAEVGAQKLLANIIGKCTPIAAIFTLIVLLFAGGWSDRYNKRKACMMVVIMGECSAFACLLISAIYFDEIPMEFGAYAQFIIPGLFGGQFLLSMAVDSYMTLTTPSENRIFRFGIYSMCIMSTPIIGQPISGILFGFLGYTMSFCLALVMNIISLLIIIFVIKEITPVPQSVDNSTVSTVSQKEQDFKPSPSVGNMAYEVTEFGEICHTKKNSSSQNKSVNGPTSSQNKNCLTSFFDTTLVINCLKLPLKKRPNHGRFILACLILANTLAIVPILNEGAYLTSFTIKKLNWNANNISIYSTVNALLSIAGTFIGTTIFSKLLKCSDALVALLSSLTTIFAKLLFGFASNTATFYAGGIVDMFFCSTLIAIKTIVTSLVSTEELSQILSLFGICQQLAQFIFSPIYSYVYENSVNSFPGAIYLLSEFLSVPNVIIFLVYYILIKRGKILSANPETSKKDNCQNNISNSNGDVEITRL